jgi:lipopolysaccharide export system permease protein
MHLISRYVLIELIKVFAVTLSGMTLLMILVGVAQEAVLQGLGPEPIVKLVPYVLPDALRFAVPGTILFAACSVYGRMSAANEVVAIRSMGSSPMTVIWPALFLSFLVSLAAVWLNDVAASWGRRGVQEVVVQSVEQIAYGRLRTQKTYSNRNFSINVKQVDGRKLKRVTVVFQNGPDGAVTLIAREAEMQRDAAKGVLSIVLFDGELDWPGKVRFVFDKDIREIPLIDATRKGESLHNVTNSPLREMPDHVAKAREEIEQLEQSLAAEAGYQMLAGDFAALNDGEFWRDRDEKLLRARERHYRLRAEPWRRWANGFSCFFFVLVGAPLAIRLKNSDLFTTFGICFLPILIAYYPLMAFGVDRAKSGSMPAYAVWLGNVILMAVGVAMLRKVVRR